LCGSLCRKENSIKWVLVLSQAQPNPLTIVLWRLHTSQLSIISQRKKRRKRKEKLSLTGVFSCCCWALPASRWNMPTMAWTWTIAALVTLAFLLGDVKVSHIAKRSLSCRLYKMSGLSLPLLSTCLAISCHTWGGVLKCPTSLRFPSLGHFISHGVPSSLKTSFDGE